MKKPNSLQTLLVLAASSLAVFSCSKSSNSSVAPSSGTTSPQTKTMLMQATNSVYQSGSMDDENLSDAMDTPDPDGGVDGGMKSSCRVVTYNPASKTYPYVETIDFGTGCTGADGITRKGIKIVTHYANPATAAAGTEVSMVTYNNFYEDSSQVRGDVKMYVKTAASPGPLVMEVVTNQLFTSTTDGDAKTISGVHYRTETTRDTINPKNDVWSITGWAIGAEVLSRDTLFTYKSTIDASNPVIKDASCGFRTQGVEDVSIFVIVGGGGKFDETLDYGTGSCDNVATLTVNNGTPQQVTLPLLYWPL